MTSPDSYLQLCVPAPEAGMTGGCVANWTERVLAHRELGWVALSDIDVAGESRPELASRAREVRVMRTEVLLPLLRKASQVVWASLFFCKTRSAAASVRPDETYEQSAATAVVTVRVVDASYFYVIGKSSQLEDIRSWPDAVVREAPLAALDFPE